MSGLKVLISGASIAGPSAAYWFAKAGAQVTVIERFPAVRPGGQSLDIRHFGVEVIQKIPGLEESIRAKRAPFDGVCFIDKNGDEYGKIFPSGDVKEQSFVSEFEILRGDLCNILVDLTRNSPNVNYVFDEQISSLETQPGGAIKVSFKNKLPDRVYDIVIAADGATSRNRKLGLEIMDDPIETTETCTSYFTVKKNFVPLVDGKHIAKALFAPKGRLMLFCPDTDPEKTRITCMKVTRTAKDLQEYRDAIKNDTIRELTIRNFEDMGYKSKEALAAMDSDDEFYATETIIVKPESLYNGHFVLLGDAGYSTATNGIGTSLAMAGAYVLAGEIHKHKGNLEAGLKAYDAKMRPLAFSYQENGGWVKRIFLPETAWGLALRTYIIQGLVKTGILGFLQRRYGGSLSAAPPKVLDDYF